MIRAFKRKNCAINEGDQSKADVYVLHAFSSNKGKTWSTRIRYAKMGYTTIACDARGHGSRRWNSSPFDWIGTMNDYDALIRERGRPAIVTGESMGGTIALSIGAVNPLVKKVFAFSALNDIDAKDYAKLPFSEATTELMGRKTKDALPKNFLRCDPANAKKFYLIGSESDFFVPIQNLYRNRDQLCIGDENTFVARGLSKFNHGNLKDRPDARSFVEKKLRD